MRLLAAAVLLLAAPSGARAAAVLWSGAGDGSSWHDPANWSPSGVPDAASDVVVGSNAVVTASAAAVVSASVALGDGASTATLRLATGTAVAGLWRVRSGSRVLFLSTQTLRAGTLRVETGGLLEQHGPVSQATVAVTVSADLFELQAGATVQLSARGYNGGQAITVGGGPGGGGSGSGGVGAGGGGHGGAGGPGGLSANGGSANGSATSPASLGSGGGGGLAPCVGGAGGGLFALFASSVVLDGLVSADGSTGVGNCSQAGGGGAGGGVRIEAVTLAGSGQILARGSTGGNGLAGRGGGGGGGGRVAVKTTGLNLSSLSVGVGAGAGGAGAPGGSAGSAGTAFVDPKVWTGNGGASCQDAANWVAGLAPLADDNVVFGSTSAAKACTWDFGGLPLATFTMEPGYQGVVTWASNLSSVTGRFLMQGGTFAASGIEFKVGGDLVQSAGVFALSNGTLTLTGTGRSVSVSSTAVFNHLVVETGASVSLGSAVVAGNLVVRSGGALTLPSGAVLRARGALTQAGSVQAAGSEVVFEGSAAQSALWNSFGTLRASGTARVTLTAANGSTVSVSGSLFVEPGAALTQGSPRLELGGHWSSSGAFNAGGATVAFVGPGEQSILAGATSFAFVEAASSVTWSTALVVSAGVSFSSASADLGGATHSVRGFWLAVGSGSFRGSSATVVFDGSARQTVSAWAASRFGRFVSSNPAGVTLASDAVVDGDLELRRGSLDLSSRTVRLRGDLRRLGGLLGGASSTFLLDGTRLQSLAMAGGAVSGLAVENSSAGARLDGPLVVLGTFTVRPGAVFDGASSSLTVSGAASAWATAGAVYLASETAHAVRWAPPPGGTLFVADGSTVAGRVSLHGPARLGGRLVVAGAGSRLELQPGASLDARSATVTLRGTADLAMSTGAAFVHDAASYLVYEGSGAERGLELSTGPYGHLALAPEDPAATFRFGSLVLDGGLVVATGTARLSAGARLELKGDLVGAGGTMDFASSSGSTVAFAGAALQSWRPGPLDAVAHLEVAGTSRTALGPGAEARVTGGLTLSSGVLAGGDGRLWLSGDWTGLGGSFSAGASTVAFVSAATQTYRDRARQAFNGLASGPGGRRWLSAFDAAVLTATHPAAALEFSTAAAHAFGDLAVDGRSTQTPVALFSALPGTPFRFTAARSTVTAALVTDADASSGPVVHANDGRSRDGGRNAGVEFRPFLLVLSPGESFAAGTGRSGSAAAQTAGVPFAVTVLAVSDRFEPVFVASVTVQAVSEDPYDAEPAPAALAGGSRTFSVSLRRAEPAPLAVRINAAGTGASGVAGSTVNALPASYAALQPLLPGEGAQPGTSLGRGGVTEFQIADRPFGLTVRAVDAFGNLVAATTNTVAVASVNGASATLPASAALAGGSVTLSGLAVHATGLLTLTVADLSSASVANAQSSTFSVYSLSASSPTVNFSLPSGASVGTLGGGVGGGARDSVAVTEVGVAVQDASTGLWFDWVSAFSQSSPVVRAAAVSPFRGTDTTWSLPFDDTRLTNGRDYFAVVRASNPAGFARTAASTFTYDRGILVFAPSDGEGAAALLPATTGACQLVTATVTLTVGASGLGPGGGAALRVPPGWTPLAGLSSALPPPAGFMTLVSTSLAWTVPGSSRVVVEPVSVGSVTLGAGWVSVSLATGAANPFRPGERLTFHYSGFPPARGAGRHLFELRTRASGAGTLVAVATAPAVTLAAAAPRGLEFAPDSVLALGPLQTSPTMQVLLTDGCGNPAPAPAATTVLLDAGRPSAAGFSPDATAAYFLAGGGSTASVTVASGASLSGGFYMRTSTTGVDDLSLRASATAAGFSFTALRFALVRGSSVAPAAVSIDTGTLAPGATSVLLTPGAGARAVVRFGVADPSVPWEVQVASEAGFTAPIFTARGFGSSDGTQHAVWDGVVCGVLCAYAAPGRYHVRVTAGGTPGTALEARVATSPYIAGTLGAAGAGALVRAEGPGAGYASAAQADASGAYRLDGLLEGRAYAVRASSSQVRSGTAVTLATAAFGVAASTGGGAAPARSFAVPALLRVSASITVLSPEELFGTALARAADGSVAAAGVLHFPRRGASSDDGGVAVGRAASTWTVLAVAPGTYSVELAVDRIGVATTVAAVSASSAAFADVAVALPRRAALSGLVVLASTGAAAVPVSVSATRGTEAVPSRLSAVTLPASAALTQSSGAWRLYGLDPGTWTVAARAPGFLAASSVVVIPSDEDVGDSSGSGGPLLPLAQGLVLRGSVTVTGDSRPLALTGPDPAAPPASGFAVLVTAHEPRLGRRESVVVALATSTALSEAAFALPGLEAGEWRLAASVPGFERSGATSAVVPQSGPGAALVYAAPSARARLTVAVPAPASPCLCGDDFARVAFVRTGPDGAAQAVAVATALAGASFSFHPASLTLLTPGLETGLHRWTFLDRLSGRTASAALALSPGSTAQASLDLTGATHTVSGRVVLTAPVTLSSGAASLALSSAGAAAAAAPRADYCLLASSAAVRLSALRVELLPRGAAFPAEAGALAAAGAGCAAWTPSGDPPAPAVAYAASVGTDGSFSVSGVPPGTYRLRVPGDLDGKDGVEAAPVSRDLTVTGDATVEVRLGPGAAVTGAALLPPGASGRRALVARLSDREGRGVGAASFEASPGAEAPFSLRGLADGDYTLRVSDAGHPPSFVARPAAVRVSGGAADSGLHRLEFAGAVRGRLAVERALSTATKELVVVTGADRSLLPESLVIGAFAVPWHAGGFYPAAGEDCGLDGCARPSFDPEGRFTVAGVLPGVYDLVLRPTAGAAGADLAFASRAGVRVEPGMTADVGVVRLRAAAALAGTLSDAAGRPVAGVAVEARPKAGSSASGRPVPRAVSDGAGRFSVGGLDPDAPYYDLVAAPRSAEADAPPPAWRETLLSGVDARSTATLALTLEPATLALTGRVASADGSALVAPEDGPDPRPGARLWVRREGGPALGGPLGELSVLTAPDGSFRVDGLGPGSYALTAAAQGHAPASRSARLAAADVSVGTMTLSRGARLAGALRRPDGSHPGRDEVRGVYAATADSAELLPGELVPDPAARAVAGYRVGGFAAGKAYRLLLLGADGEFTTPAEGAALSFSSATESRTLDLVVRPPVPRVVARSRRSGGTWLLDFHASQPLRSRSAADDDLARLLSTVSARGALSGAALSADRRRLSAVYTPGVDESSFTLRFVARGALRDPDAADGSEFLLSSTVTFYAGLDGYHEARLANLVGGTLSVEGDAGRLTLPKGAFLTDASSPVPVALRRSDELLLAAPALAAAGYAPAEAATRALRHPPDAYPKDLLRALAATPPDVRPAGPYYDVVVGSGLPTRLARPARLTLAASAGKDPAALNVYWYNEAANAYVLQQDARGAALEVDAANRTVSLDVDHFSTFVLFDAAAAVISGNAYGGGELKAYNFPNPFDLRMKTVTPIHGAAAGAVRGTMIRVAVPAGVDGDARVFVFSAAGERVKTLSLGTVSGGRTYYQPWDGTNDAGRDVASGLYIGQAKVGSQSVFFKMAVLK